MPKTHIQPTAPAALKPWWLACASTAPYVVPECAFHEFTKCPWLPTAMAMSQMIMPTQTTTKATSMYRATTRTPSTITAVNIAVRIVAMTEPPSQLVITTILTGMIVSAVLVAELAGAIYWLGEKFTRFDLSTEMPR